jgi:4-hydroxybenzoate polyprenyltransferase
VGAPVTDRPESLAATDADERALAPRVATDARWLDYAKPFRVDHWIKNLVVPVGGILALVAAGASVTAEVVAAIVAAFLISGGISSVNYAINEVLDAPFDARHPVKHRRPIPSGRVRIGPLLVLTALLGLITLTLAIVLFGPAVEVAVIALFVAGLIYNLPPVRLKDWPYLDAVVESLTNPIRLAIGWYAVSAEVVAAPPPLALMTAVWALGASVMTGKRLAELRLLGAEAARYRPTFRAYTVGGLLAAQVAYGAVGLTALGVLFAAQRPRLLAALPLVGLILLWTFRMAFERDSPLIDPEHLHRRPLFLLLSLAVFAVLVIWAVR